MVKRLVACVLFFVVALIIPDCRVWWLLVSVGVPRLVALACFIPTLITIFSFMAFISGRYHNTFMRLFFIFVLIIALPKFIFVIFFILSPMIAIVIALAILLVMVYGFVWGWRRIVVKRTTCSSPRLPEEFNGYKVVQLSDLHIGTFLKTPSFMSKLVKVVNGLHPDLIVFTGDLVNIRAEELRPFMGVLSQMSAPDGVYSVMGNHDYCEYGNRITEKNSVRNQHVLCYLEGKMGWHMLLNEHVRLRRGDSMIALIGVENISKPPFGSRGDLKKAMSGLAEGSFKILLSHDPSHWRHGVLGDTDIALTLSGHTHAGQLKIGRFSPVKWTYREWGGKYVDGDSMLYVSLGLGGTMPFRLGAYPEVNVITLVRRNP